jgi:hypothetical protein
MWSQKKNVYFIPQQLHFSLLFRQQQLNFSLLFRQQLP